MKPSMKRTAAFFVDPKSMMFGVAIFTFMWVWVRSPEFHFHRDMYVAVLLLASSILILLNKRWSNLVAGILSGYLPLEILREFWMYHRHAEVPLFSPKHFIYLLGNIDIEGGALMFIAVTLMMLTRSVFAIMQLKEV
jgi:hypothetical protein